MLDHTKAIFQILKAIDCEAKVGDQKIIILKVLKDIIKDKTTILSKVAKGKSEDEKENRHQPIIYPMKDTIV